jgi:hypothetical protein
MRRPLLLQGTRLFGRRAGQPLANGLELQFKRLNFLMLTKNHVAEFGHGLLEVGYFRLNALQRFFRRQRQCFTP